MIRQKDFRKFEVRYHRNGISGTGFLLCRFLFLQGKSATEMSAVVFDEPGSVAVTSANINDRWRGDEFEPALREAIKAVKRSQPESIHSHDNQVAGS